MPGNDDEVEVIFPDSPDMATPIARSDLAEAQRQGAKLYQPSAPAQAPLDLKKTIGPVVRRHNAVVTPLQQIELEEYQKERAAKGIPDEYSPVLSDKTLRSPDLYQTALAEMGYGKTHARPDWRSVYRGPGDDEAYAGAVAVLAKNGLEGPPTLADIQAFKDRDWDNAMARAQQRTEHIIRHESINDGSLPERIALRDEYDRKEKANVWARGMDSGIAFGLGEMALGAATMGDDPDQRRHDLIKHHREEEAHGTTSFMGRSLGVLGTRGASGPGLLAKGATGLLGVGGQVAKDGAGNIIGGAVKTGIANQAARHAASGFGTNVVSSMAEDATSVASSRMARDPDAPADYVDYATGDMTAGDMTERGLWSGGVGALAEPILAAPMIAARNLRYGEKGSLWANATLPDEQGNVPHTSKIPGGGIRHTPADAEFLQGSSSESSQRGVDPLARAVTTAEDAVFVSLKDRVAGGEEGVRLSNTVADNALARYFAAAEHTGAEAIGMTNEGRALLDGLPEAHGDVATRLVNQIRASAASDPYAGAVANERALDLEGAHTPPSHRPASVVAQERAALAETHKAEEGAGKVSLAKLVNHYRDFLSAYTLSDGHRMITDSSLRGLKTVADGFYETVYLTGPELTTRNAVMDEAGKRISDVVEASSHKDPFTGKYKVTVFRKVDAREMSTIVKSLDVAVAEIPDGTPLNKAAVELRAVATGIRDGAFKHVKEAKAVAHTAATKREEMIAAVGGQRLNLSPDAQPGMAEMDVYRGVADVMREPANIGGDILTKSHAVATWLDDVNPALAADFRDVQAATRAGQVWHAAGSRSTHESGGLVKEVDVFAKLLSSETSPHEQAVAADVLGMSLKQRTLMVENHYLNDWFSMLGISGKLSKNMSAGERTAYNDSLASVLRNPAARKDLIAKAPPAYRPMMEQAGKAMEEADYAMRLLTTRSSPSPIDWMHPPEGATARDQLQLGVSQALRSYRETGKATVEGASFNKHVELGAGSGANHSVNRLLRLTAVQQLMSKSASTGLVVTANNMTLYERSFAATMAAWFDSLMGEGQRGRIGLGEIGTKDLHTPSFVTPFASPFGAPAEFSMMADGAGREKKDRKWTPTEAWGALRSMIFESEAAAAKAKGN